MRTHLSYANAVDLLRTDSAQELLLEHAYLDKDPSAAWARFERSEEWHAVKKLLKLDSTRHQQRVLDVGCGNGIASIAFARAGHAVIAADPDGDCSVGCGALTQQSNPSISAVRSFAEALPFANASFDIVYGRQVLHHLRSLPQGLCECARVLRADGSMLFCREHVVDDQKSLDEFLEHHPLHRYHGGENAYPLQTYLAAFRDAGLRVVKVLGPFDSVINHFPTSNVEVQAWFVAALEKCVGKGLAASLSRIRWLEHLYRCRLSRRFRLPGRLYSFLAVVDK